MKRHATPFLAYFEFLKEYRKLAPEVQKKNERFIFQIQAELRTPLIQAKRGSEISAAIVEAASKRKIVDNGGHQDDGTGMRFRLGQAAVGFYRWAYSEALIERNPYEKNPFPPAPTREAYHLTEDDLKKVIKRINTLALRERAIICFFMDTGVRVSELCNVKIHDINFEESFVTVYMSKVQRPKEPPLSNITIRLIKRYLKTRRHKSEYLFVNRYGRYLSTNLVRVFLREFGQTLGIRINPHSFRHAVGALWIKHVDQIKVCQLLGHVTMRMTNHYIHLKGKDLKEDHRHVHSRSPALRLLSKKIKITA